MVTRSWCAAVIACIGAGGVACGTQPVSNIAVEGTTIAIAVPSFFDVGYGRSLYETSPDIDIPMATVIAGGALTGVPLGDPDPSLEDLQRGELVLTLVDAGGTGAAIAILPVRYVMSLGPDWRTRVSRDVNSNDYEQTIVFADIPVLDESGGELFAHSGSKAYRIEFRRYRRASFADGATAFEAAPMPSPRDGWVGWGNPTETAKTFGVPIEIRDAEGDFPAEVTNFGFGPDGGDFMASYWHPFLLQVLTVPADPDELIPDPTFAVNVFKNGKTPAAMEIEFDYPAERIEITGVRLIAATQREAWTSYTVDNPVPCSNGPTPGTMRVLATDPGATFGGFEVS